MKKLFKTFLFLIAPLALASCGNAPSNYVYTASIKLDSESVSLDQGDTFQLAPLAYDKDGNQLKDKTFIYRSSVNNVATVDANGLITAKNKGTSTISIISDTMNTVFYVTVGGEEEELVSFEFNPSEVTIRLGATYTPNIVTFPSGLEKTYNWFSDDENIASASDGKIIGKAAGTTNITATYGQLSSKIKVTVSEQGGEFSMTLNRDNISLVKGNTFQLIATTSEEATITWASEKDTVASVDKDGLVSANGKGSTVITASANGVTCSCTVIVSSGEDPDPGREKDLIIYYYVDYNNIDTPYAYENGFEWYTGVPIGVDNIPTAPLVAPDPAFPNFAGWSNHTIIDDLDDLWDFANDVVPDGVYTYVFYGIWFD